MFHVTLTNQGTQFWLRGTTWAFHADRAQQFASVEAAQAGLEKAKKFMKPRAAKLAIVEPVTL